MKITPVPSLANTVGSDGAPPSNPVFKMATQVDQTQAMLQEHEQKLIIPPNNDTLSNENVEATHSISPEYAELAKRRRALQVKERELSEREQQLKQASEQAVISVEHLKSKPLDVLLDSGVTYEQLTEAILARQGNSEINALKAEIAALKEGIDKKFTERDTQAETQVLAEMQKQATQIVAQDDTFELVKAMKKIPDVMRLIKETYHQSGEILDVKEALQEVENYLLNDIQKLVSLKKIQTQFAQPQQQGMRTLTNRDTASVPLSPKQRAIAAFNRSLIK